jgi:hypothetical protein
MKERTPRTMPMKNMTHPAIKSPKYGEGLLHIQPIKVSLSPLLHDSRSDEENTYGEFQRALAKLVLSYQQVWVVCGSSIKSNVSHLSKRKMSHDVANVMVSFFEHVLRWGSAGLLRVQHQSILFDCHKWRSSHWSGSRCLQHQVESRS